MLGRMLDTLALRLEQPKREKWKYSEFLDLPFKDQSSHWAN
jgi:hypothetical protein